MLWLYIKLFFFFKKRRGLELVILPHFRHDFWKKIFLNLSSIKQIKFHCQGAFTSSYIGNMCIIIICLTVFVIISFEFNHSFLIKPFSHMAKMIGENFNYLKNEKGFNHEIKSIFLSFLKGLQLSEVVSDPRVGF